MIPSLKPPYDDEHPCLHAQKPGQMLLGTIGYETAISASK